VLTRYYSIRGLKIKLRLLLYRHRDLLMGKGQVVLVAGTRKGIDRYLAESYSGKRSTLKRNNTRKTDTVGEFV